MGEYLDSARDFVRSHPDRYVLTPSLGSLRRTVSGLDKAEQSMSLEKMYNVLDDKASAAKDDVYGHPDRYRLTPSVGPLRHALTGLEGSMSLEMMSNAVGDFAEQSMSLEKMYNVLDDKASVAKECNTKLEAAARLQGIERRRQIQVAAKKKKRDSCIRPAVVIRGSGRL